MPYYEHMAQLVPSALPTLGTVLSAAVFSTTFLSGRVHRERGRALDRAHEIDDRLLRNDRDSGSIEGSTLDEQYEALRGALRDRFVLPLVALNVLLMVAAVGLSLSFAAQAGELNLHILETADGWSLSVLLFTVTVVVTVGVVDIVATRHELNRRIDNTVVGQLATAHRLIIHLKKLDRLSKQRKELQRATEYAERAVVTSRGKVTQAWATLGYAQLLSARAADADSDTFESRKMGQEAEANLRRAADESPNDLTIALALVAAISEYNALESMKEAEDIWLHALDQLSQAYFESPTIQRLRERKMMITAAGSLDMYRGFVLVSNSELLYVKIVNRLPNDDWRVWFALREIARLLSRKSNRKPWDADFVVTHTRAFLDEQLRRAQEGPWSPFIDNTLQELKSLGSSVIELQALVEEYTRADGPVELARKAHERSFQAERERHRRLSERSRELVESIESDLHHRQRNSPGSTDGTNKEAPRDP